MRVIYKASLVFLLKDIYSKMPVTDAVILCNGKQNPYTRKKTGQYVFSNLYPMEYNISISCKGYNSIEFPVLLKENETKEMTFDLSYSLDNQNILNMTRFDITCYKGKKKRFSNAPIRFKLRNELNYLKLLEPIKAQSDVLKLNVEMITDLLGQKYVYDVGYKSYDFVFWSYDQEKKAYILKDYVGEEVPTNGKFYAVWDIKTDPSGKIIMPLIPQFMKESKLEIELVSGNKRAIVHVDISGKHTPGEVFYFDAKFKAIPKKELEERARLAEEAKKKAIEEAEKKAAEEAKKKAEEEKNKDKKGKGKSKKPKGDAEDTEETNDVEETPEDEEENEEEPKDEENSEDEEPEDLEKSEETSEGEEESKEEPKGEENSEDEEPEDLEKPDETPEDEEKSDKNN